MERIEHIAMPTDVHERADDVATNFSRGIDIDMFALALHQVLVPGVESIPNETAGKMRDQSGAVTAELAQPEDRAAIYETAASRIQELAMKRRGPEDDEAFLARVANIVGLTIVMAHTYADGNGRTSRVMAQLIAGGPAGGRDDPRFGGDDGALRFMASSKEASGRDPNRTDSFSDGYKPLGFIPASGQSYEAILRNAAALDLRFDDTDAYAAQYQSGGMAY